MLDGRFPLLLYSFHSLLLPSFKDCTNSLAAWKERKGTLNSYGFLVPEEEGPGPDFPPFCLPFPPPPLPPEEEEEDEEEDEEEEEEDEEEEEAPDRPLFRPVAGPSPSVVLLTALPRPAPRPPDRGRKLTYASIVLSYIVALPLSHLSEAAKGGTGRRRVGRRGGRGGEKRRNM